jgi:phage shock protein A
MVVDSANSARLRLLRLSDAADKLRQQAAISVPTGKENDARQLLLQKKKVILALEKSKHCIELLDELSAKLNEVE